ncbi:hypothetical protein GCM10028832_02840 [Streptomyces sparsus]
MPARRQGDGGEVEGLLAGGELAQQELVLEEVAVDVGPLQGLVQALCQASPPPLAALLVGHRLGAQDQRDGFVQRVLADEAGGVRVLVGDAQPGQQAFACLAHEDGDQAA